MMRLQATDVDLVGKWIYGDGLCVADPTTLRIKYVIKHCLRQIAEDPGGWVILYFDPADERLWELNYPQGVLQGGGPPRLTMLSEEQARKRFNLQRFAGKITKASMDWRGRHAELLKRAEEERT